MNGYEGRTKGKRFRKPQCGGSNVKERWKYLSAQTSDVVRHEEEEEGGHSGLPRAKPVRKQTQQSHPHRTSKSIAQQNGADGTRVATSMRVGYDIDGDGQIDVREMRLAKFLDAMVEDRYKHDPHRQQQQHDQPSESELTRMRQEAGRLLIAKEFVERNHDRLWRYGSIFTGKSEAQSAEFIAAHKNFQKLMPFLENLERKRTIRSSQNLRSCVQNGDGDNGEINGLTPRDSQEDARLVRQTWIETSRKVYDPVFSKHPLPELQPKKKVNVQELHPVSEDVGHDAYHHHPEVLFNTYGAIDVDGDGVVDDDEMKLHLRLQEATLDDNNSNHSSGHNRGLRSSSSMMNPHELRQLQQLEGRKMMAKDFVQRNEGQLWLYEPSYRNKSTDEIVLQIADNAQFAKEFNKLRAKERMLRLKSSMGVSNCLVQLPATELPADPSNSMEFRRVRHRSELLLARKELLKPPQHHAMQQQQMMMQQQQQQRHSVGSAPMADTNSSSHANNPHGGLRIRAVREDRRDLGRPASDSQIGLPKIYDTPMRIEATGSFSVTKWKFGD